MGRGGKPTSKKFFPPHFRHPRTQGMQGPSTFPPLGSEIVHGSEDISVQTCSWRVVIWKWLDCPFCCHITFLGVSSKKLGLGETGERTRHHMPKPPSHGEGLPLWFSDMVLETALQTTVLDQALQQLLFLPLTALQWWFHHRHNIRVLARYCWWFHIHP